MLRGGDDGGGGGGGGGDGSGGSTRVCVCRVPGGSRGERGRDRIGAHHILIERGLQRHTHAQIKVDFKGGLVVVRGCFRGGVVGTALASLEVVVVQSGCDAQQEEARGEQQHLQLDRFGSPPLRRLHVQNSRGLRPPVSGG